MNELQRVRKAINWLIYVGFAENEREVAEKLGYKKASLSQILNGHTPLSEKFVKKLCSADSNLNEVWILTGEGEMFLNPQTVAPPAETVTIPQDVWGVIKAQAESLQSKDKQIEELVGMLRQQIADAKKMAAQREDNAASAAAV